MCLSALKGCLTWSSSAPKGRPRPPSLAHLQSTHPGPSSQTRPWWWYLPIQMDKASNSNNYLNWNKHLNSGVNTPLQGVGRWQGAGLASLNMSPYVSPNPASQKPAALILNTKESISLMSTRVFWMSRNLFKNFEEHCYQEDHNTHLHAILHCPLPIWL